jgi:hypothetical protein
MNHEHFRKKSRFLYKIMSCVSFSIISDNNMDASKVSLNSNQQAGEFEPVYIKQEEGIIPPLASAILKSEDKVKLIFLLQ